MIGDISNKKNFKLIDRKFNYVVNLGGYVDHTNKTKTYNSHFKGCKILSNFFLKKKIESFIQMGSSGEYGMVKSPQQEKFHMSPSINICQIKIFSDKILNKFTQEEKISSYDFKTVPSLRSKTRYKQIYTNRNRCMLKKISFNCSDGKQLRDFVYVSDVVNAIIQSIKKQKFQRTNYKYWVR